MSKLRKSLRKSMCQLQMSICVIVEWCFSQMWNLLLVNSLMMILVQFYTMFIFLFALNFSARLRSWPPTLLYIIYSVWIGNSSRLLFIYNFNRSNFAPFCPIHFRRIWKFSFSYKFNTRFSCSRPLALAVENVCFFNISLYD